MMDHIEDFDAYEEVGAIFFTSIPGFMDTNQSYVSWAILIGGGAFLAYYVWAQKQLQLQGHAVSLQKVYLLASTGAVSIYTWGFNTFGEAFFIMNLFHALQYFGIVWAFENKNMMKLFHLDRRPVRQTTGLAALRRNRGRLRIVGRGTRYKPRGTVGRDPNRLHHAFLV